MPAPRDHSFRQGMTHGSPNPLAHWSPRPPVLRDWPPRGDGLRDPNFEERVAITHAELRRAMILQLAVPRLKDVLTAYRAAKAAAGLQFAHALRYLFFFGDRLDPSTPRG